MSGAMKRTTIMLPEDLRRRAMFKARQRGVSLGELIRNSLEASLPGSSNDPGKDPLFEDAVFEGPTPRDLARRHDDYLYEE